VSYGQRHDDAFTLGATPAVGEMPEQREDALLRPGKLADELLDGDAPQLILNSNEQRRGEFVFNSFIHRRPRRE
jgi:hypothetical protein